MILMRKISQPLCSIITGLAILAGLLLPGTAQAVELSAVTPQLESIVQDGPQVSLQWTLNEQVKISGYEIERSLDPFTGFNVLLTTNQKTTSTVDQGVESGQGYYYRIRAYTNGKNTAYSQYSSVEFADVIASGAVDTAPPSVTLINPDNNTIISTEQTIDLTADAFDDLGIERVDFYRNDNLVGTSNAHPYEMAWAVSATNNGQHRLQAKAHDSAGNVATSTAVTLTVDIQDAVAPVPSEYTAPVMESVQVDGNNFIVSWSLPESAYGQPEGGFDVFTDGVDDNLHHTGNSTVVNGLQAGVEHCFQVEARWTQASPSVFPASNTMCAQIEDTADTTLPTVAISSPSTNASYNSDQTVVIVASAQDDSGVTKVEFYNGTTLIGTDTTNTFSVSWPVSEADNGQHSITAKAYDAAGNVATSSAVTLTVDIAATPTAPAEYTAPVLQSVQANGNDFVVSWLLPESAYGQPEGGFDVFTDGVDDNLHHTGNSTVVNGLQAGVEHCFQVEARWTQASPSVFPASSTLCAQAAAPADTSAPTISITSPASGAQYTSEQTVSIVASAQDNIGVSKVEFYEGSVLKATDASTPYSYDWSITDVDKGSHSFTAKAYDVAGNVVTSAAVSLTVDIQIAPAEYMAPVLESVEVNGSDFVVSWILPETAYGQPEGGYDLFTDGVDDNLHHTGNSTIVSGLQSGVEHCFMLEARWTQADPSQFPASNVICAQAEETTPTPESPVISGPVKVFPGAQGFGAVTIAGRGGKVIKVTNLNDSGTGSFRDAVQASGPRIVVFEVGGEINLKSQLWIRN
ncbi:MAG: hypothetical protein IH613_01025, partial [Desulfuromonadales bacterium]|nr:hypothetical protein [Desulfuromonadales bacterium]